MTTAMTAAMTTTARAALGGGRPQSWHVREASQVIGLRLAATLQPMTLPVASARRGGGCDANSPIAKQQQDTTEGASFFGGRRRSPRALDCNG
jgi:hypothetical protein